MKRRLVPRPALIPCFLFTLLLWPALGGWAAVPDAMRQADPRLEKRVTLVAAHLPIGELLEVLSQRSGVALTANDGTEAGDTEVTVALHQAPLADAMNALWSLVSYRQAEWEWRRQGDAKNYRYELARSGAARSLSARLREQLQKEFEGQADTLISALKMTPEELAQAAKRDRLLGSLIDDDRVRPGMSIFAALPPDLRSAVLKGGQTLEIPVSQLPASGGDFVHSQWLWTRDHGGKTRAPDGTLIPVPEPQKLFISTLHLSGEIAPCLLIDTGFGSINYVGGGYMEGGWQEKMTALWMLPGDDLDDPQSAKQAPAPRPPAAPDARRPLHSRLLQMAEAAPFSFIARLPDEGSAGDGLPPHQSLKAYLSRLQETKHVQSKWRHGILLLTTPALLIEDADNPPAPWPLVKRLRDAEAPGDGFLPLAELAHAAHQLSRPQLRRLAAYFPVMDSIAQWQDLFALYDESVSLRPYVKSPAGSTRGDVLETVASNLGLSQTQLNQPGVRTRTRLVEKQHPERKPPTHEITVEVVTDKGNVLAAQGLTYPAHQFQPGVEAPR